MIVKIFSKIGIIYTKIHEEEIDNLGDIEIILKKWKYADLIEVFDGDRLVFVYENC
jgi:hypothetical protein